MENGDVRKLKRHSHGSLPFGSKHSDEIVSIGRKNFEIQNFLNFLLLAAYCEISQKRFTYAQNSLTLTLNTFHSRRDLSINEINIYPIYLGFPFVKDFIAAS